MKILPWLLLFSLPVFAIDWSQPEVGCPEEILPQGRACPDLSSVANVFTDLPVRMSEAEREAWRSSWWADLKLCQHVEVLRREAASPGSFTPLQQQIAWMVVEGGKDVPAKLDAVMTASARHRIPPQVLLGAITQESLLAALGVSPDGGNYSCGIAQLNLPEWCVAMAALPSAERSRLEWPAVGCESLPSTLVAPFYEIARERLGGRPEYRITASEFSGISPDQVLAAFPGGSASLQSARFRAVTSFLAHCQDVRLSIAAKAQNLRRLYDRHVPAALKAAGTYAEGETFGRACNSPHPVRQWPLHPGWLLAVAAYNAGPNQSKILEHYYGVRGGVFPDMNPTDLIEALHWGGRARAGSTRVFFTGEDGIERSQQWYKSCVVQRHVARVVQHVTLPGRILATPVNQAACAQGPIPAYRRDSSGVRE